MTHLSLFFDSKIRKTKEKVSIHAPSERCEKFLCHELAAVTQLLNLLTKWMMMMLTARVNHHAIETFWIVWKRKMGKRNGNSSKEDGVERKKNNGQKLHLAQHDT